MTRYDQAPTRAARLFEQLLALGPAMRARAPALDRDGDFPRADLDALREIGLLAAPLPASLGGLDLGTAPAGASLASDCLRCLGAANPAVARLWEAHLNALRLVLRFGAPAQVELAARDARAGHLFGVWVTDPPGAAPLRAERGQLVGRKGPCSGAGHCTRALVTAEDAGGRRMAMIALSGGETVTPIAGLQGLRAGAQGTITLDGIAIPPEAWIGGPGDYLREPEFSCGAWRGSAAAAGALEAIVGTVRDSLIRSGRADAVLQRARFGELCIAQETARLWVGRARDAAEQPGQDPREQVATVNLARIAVEQACLRGITLAQRSLGLAGFVAPHPLDRLARDLATYLRQPHPDDVLLSAAEHFLRAAP